MGYHNIMKLEIQPMALYTTQELKKFLSVGDNTIWRIAKENKINHTKVGKRYVWLGKDILKFLEAK